VPLARGKKLHFKKLVFDLVPLSHDTPWLFLAEPTPRCTYTVPFFLVKVPGQDMVSATVRSLVFERFVTKGLDSENFVTNDYGAGRLFSVTKVFVIDSRRPAATVISKKILRSFRTANTLIYVL
jgi:hypothetical protein